MNYLKLSPEYECSPLWISSDGEVYENLQISNTPFDEVLKKKLVEWAETFDATLNQDYPPDSGFANSEDELTFEKNGVIIWGIILKNYYGLYQQVLFKSILLNRLYSNIDEYYSELNSKISITKPH